MQIFRTLPRPRNDRVAVQPVVDVIGRRLPELGPKPRQVVIDRGVVALAPARMVEISIVEQNVVETDACTFGIHVHLPDRLCLVPGASELSWQGRLNVERHPVEIRDASMTALRKA